MTRLFRSVLLVLMALMLPNVSEAREGPASFADLAEKLLPAVVNISTTQTVTIKDDMQDFQDLQIPPGSPFEDFFKDFMEKQQGLGNKTPGSKPHKRKSMALGSGFVIDPAGYIVTNNHVIQDADEITVILQDDTNLPATVIGRDKKTDLALLKVNSKKPLPALVWGDSDKIRVGDWNMAIGNPYGLGGTVTAGIISARARDIQSGPYDDYLQTDAPINRGNSGGPMFNMEGEVIGVNTAIYSPSGGSVGIGFAIPSSMAKSVIDQLKSTGHVKRGWIGVRIQAVTQDIADSLGLGTPRGALVSSVTTDGPAAKAHVEVGDVVVSFNNKDVQDMHSLPRIVAETPVETTVPVKLFRKGKETTLQIKVGELDTRDEATDEQVEKPEPEAVKSSGEKISELGINASTITDALRKQYDIGKDTNGVVVTAIEPDSVAGERGIQTGDVISEAGQKEIKSAKEFADTVKQSKKDNKPLLLLVDRKGDLRFVAINLGKKE